MGNFSFDNTEIKKSNAAKYLSAVAKIKKEFQGNYRFNFDEKRHEIAKCNHSILWLYIFGILLIVVTMVLTGFYHGTEQAGQAYSMYFDIASQVTSIASWVFIWDAVDKQAFERRDLKKESLRWAQLCGAEINFVTPQEKSEVGEQKWLSPSYAMF